MTEPKPKSTAEIAQIARDTVAQSQKALADLENTQRDRGTPFTSDEIKQYEEIITTGVEQAKQVNKLLEEE